MKRVTKIGIPLALSLIISLAGCSGSSSSGAPSGNAGTYRGTTISHLSGPSGTSHTSRAMVLTVSVSGEVDWAWPGSSSGNRCDSSRDIKWSGNTFRKTYEGFCDFAGVGRCPTEGVQTVIFNGNQASYSSTENAFCSRGTYRLTFSGTLNKV